jgi:DNA-binding protein YbaB
MNRATQFSLEKAIGELRQQQETLLKKRSEMRSTTSKVSSRDHMITVSMDATGEITSISFNTAKFRRMAPAELGAALTETINQARAEIRQRVVETYGAFMPAGLDLESILTGKADFSAMFDDAVRKSNDIMNTMPSSQ